MSLLTTAQQDYRDILGDLEAFSLALSFENPTATETAAIVGHGMTHYLKYDTDGQVVNGKNSHVTFAEKDLVDAGYTVRNAKGLVSLDKHKVTFANSNGVSTKHIIIESFPDETLGIITCILGTYAS